MASRASKAGLVAGKVDQVTGLVPESVLLHAAELLRKLTDSNISNFGIL